MWAKVDDGWWCHPKVMHLSMAARGLWISALSWSCAQRLDEVPTVFLAMVQAEQELADELADAGLWIATDDGWRIHDWAEYQDLTTSERRAAAGRKGGKRSGEVRRSKSKQTEANTASDQGKQRSKPKQTEVASEANDEAGPTRPDPTLPDPTTTSSQDYTDTVPDEPVAPVVDEQTIRRTAVAVGRTVAEADPTVGDPAAYAASVTRRILRGDDPADRDSIRVRLEAGESPEAIAADWQAPAPLVDDRPGGEPRNPLTVPKATAPDCPTCAGAGMWLDDDDGLARPCPECRPGAVPVPRLAVVQ